MFVRVPRSSTDKSFNNNKPWVDDALKVNGSKHGGTYEHITHVSDGADIPTRQVAIECIAITEHLSHVPDGADIPTFDNAPLKTIAL